jgi:hypothetical protein
LGYSRKIAPRCGSFISGSDQLAINPLAVSHLSFSAILNAAHTFFKKIKTVPILNLKKRRQHLTYRRFGGTLAVGFSLRY